MAKNAVLTPQQRKFIAVYLDPKNKRDASKAYRAAYNTKATPQRVAEQASKLLRHPKVAPIIARAEEKDREAVDRVIEKHAISVEWVVGELAKIGRADPRQAVRWGAIVLGHAEDGTPVRGGRVIPIDSDQIPDDVAASISEIAETPNGIRIKFHDKRAALVDIGRHLGMFPTKVTLGGSVGLEVRRRPDLSKLNDDDLAAYEALLEKCEAEDDDGSDSGA